MPVSESVMSLFTFFGAAAIVFRCAIFFVAWNDFFADVVIRRHRLGVLFFIGVPTMRERLHLPLSRDICLWVSAAASPPSPWCCGMVVPSIQSLEKILRRPFLYVCSRGVGG